MRALQEDIVHYYMYYVTRLLGRPEFVTKQLTLTSLSHTAPIFGPMSHTI
jgi:hypothetical protein